MRRSTDIGILRILRIMAVAWAASMAAACTANTWERISPDPAGYTDSVKSVTSAHRGDDGSVVICVTGYPASPPAVFGSNPVEAFSLILPAETTGLVPVEARPLRRRDDRAATVHPTIRRYDLAATELAGPCRDPKVSGIAVPVHTIRHSDLGYESHESFSEIPAAAVAGVIERQATPPAVYAFITYEFGGRRAKVVYVAAKARFDGVRAVLIEPGVRRPVKGNPLYIPVLPVAAVLDVLTVPVFIFAVVTGIYRG